jgi:hypothetical protein
MKIAYGTFLLAGFAGLLGKIGWDSIIGNFFDYKKNHDTITAKANTECQEEVENLKMIIRNLKDKHINDISVLETEKNELFYVMKLE